MPYGRVTARGIGGGHKQKIRLVDFKRNKHGIEATVAAIEYDPMRSARLALLQYTDGEKRYIIAPVGIKVGLKISSGPTAPPEIGNALPLKAIPVSSAIHNLELIPGKRRPDGAFGGWRSDFDVARRRICASPPAFR